MRNYKGLAAVTPISESEIATELYSRNYTTGQAPPPATISRADAIKYGVNKALDTYGYARKATSLTYIEVVTYSNIVAYAKTWANYYLEGTQTPASNVMGLRSVKGGLWGLNNNEAFYRFGKARLGRSRLGRLGQTAIPPPTQPGISGWGILLTLVGQGLITYGNYLTYKNTMVQQGYTFPQVTGSTYDYYKQQLYQINPNLTQQQIDQILSPYGKQQSETPTWVWVALGLGAVYVMTQRR